MAGNLSFDDAIFTDDYNKIEKDLKNMEIDIKEVLFNFINEMPEMQSIILRER